LSVRHDGAATASWGVVTATSKTAKQRGVSRSVSAT